MAKNLKQEIVVVNEFSSGGSRGSSPGKYVRGYMARDDAVEIIAPIARGQKGAVSAYVERYMARKEAVDTAVDLPHLVEQTKDAAGSGGVSFGYGKVSLTHQELLRASTDLQQVIEGSDGQKTFLKTVLSFDEEYLRRHKIIPEDFEHKERGDYRGNLDQLKLRSAIMAGLGRLGASNRFDDLRYIGVIQVDTNHVHCHLAMVDAGVGVTAVDGTQKGKLSRRDVAILRRGTDAFLDQNKRVAFLSSAVDYDSANVRTFVKKWTHERIAAQALPQLLIASLPKDRTLWRAGTNHRSMQRSNEVMGKILDSVLEQEGSPYVSAVEAVRTYAKTRTRREGLSKAESQKLIDRGIKDVRNAAANSVYTMLKGFSTEQLVTRTAAFDVGSLSDETLKAKAADGKDELMVFAHRLRSYSKRLDGHKTKRDEAKNQYVQLQEIEDAGQLGLGAQVLKDFYELEVAYHDRLVSKYQKLTYLGVDREGAQLRLDELADFSHRIDSLKALSTDKTLAQYKHSGRAESLGQDIYGVAGGGLMTSRAGRSRIKKRIESMEKSFGRRYEQLRDELADSMISFDESLVAQVGTRYDFSEVKGLDLHAMTADSARDIKVSPEVIREYSDWSRARGRAVGAAVKYLRESGQLHALGTLPLEEVRDSALMMQKLSRDGILESKVADAMEDIELPQQVTIAPSILTDRLVSTRIQLEVNSATERYRARRLVSDADFIDDFEDQEIQEYVPRHRKNVSESQR